MSSISLSPVERRRFFLGVSAALLVLAAWGLVKDRPAGPWLLAGAALLAAVELALPRVASRLFAAWMAFARALGAVNSRVLIAVIYVALFVPIGLARAAKAGSRAETRRIRARRSAWGAMPEESPSRESYFRPY